MIPSQDPRNTGDEPHSCPGREASEGKAPGAGPGRVCRTAGLPAAVGKENGEQEKGRAAAPDHRESRTRQHDFTLNETGEDSC